MVEDQSHRILSLSRQIRELSSELDQLLILQSTRSNTSSTHSSASVTPPSTPPDLQPRSYKEFLVGDIVRITNRYKGYRGCLASILDILSKDTFALKLLSNGETLNKRKWNVEFVRRPSNYPS